MPKRRCHQCKKSEVRAADITVSEEVAGRKFAALVSGTRCSHCGTETLSGPALGVFELRVARELLDAGERGGKALRYARKALGYTAADLGEILGIAPETLSRWETDTRPADVAAVALLAAMVRDRLDGRDDTRATLAALHKPKRAARAVDLGRVA